MAAPSVGPDRDSQPSRDGGTSGGLLAVRYVLPAAIAAAGIVVQIVGSGPVADGLSASLIGAAALVVLLNLFMRLGLESNRDREREEEARRFFDRHGRWPGRGDS